MLYFRTWTISATGCDGCGGIHDIGPLARCCLSILDLLPRHRPRADSGAATAVEWGRHASTVACVHQRQVPICYMTDMLDGSVEDCQYLRERCGGGLHCCGSGPHFPHPALMPLA